MKEAEKLYLTADKPELAI